MSLCSLEGNVGVGKSTVLRELEKRGVRVHQEAVEHWTLLERFYKDPVTFSFAFQNQVLSSYAATPPETQLVERCADIALGVFVPMLQERDSLTEEEVTLLHEIKEALPLRPIRKFIYLQADVDLCMQRIAWRSRGGEEAISKQYLKDLDSQYMRFFETLDASRYTIVTVTEDLTPTQVAELVLAALC